MPKYGSFNKLENWTKNINWIISKYFYVEGCGGLMTESKGVLETPSYPLLYPNGTECNWLIKVSFWNMILFSKLLTWKKE